jgi:hypothetical protein
MTTMEIPDVTEINAFYTARFTELAIAAESARTDALSDAFQMAGDAGHCAVVDRIPNNHGYPYQARCLCGWVSLAYTTRGVAADIAAEHAGGRLAR